MAIFYRPSTGLTENFKAEVPLATAQIKEATPVPVTLQDSKPLDLWLVKIPLAPARHLVQ